MTTALATLEEHQVASREPSLSVVPSVQFEDLQVALAGDLSRLTAEGRVRFYTQLCEFTGINPLAKPFDWLTFQGKLTLYPNKGCAEQLRKLHAIDFEQNPERKLEFGCLIMTVRCSDKNGRKDFATAALPFDERMTPADKATAIMKLETKAKRRATLSICGLTMFTRELGEDPEEVDEVTRGKLHNTSSTESSSDRAAKLNQVIDAEVTTEKSPPETAKAESVTDNSGHDQPPEPVSESRSETRTPGSSTLPSDELFSSPQSTGQPPASSSPSSKATTAPGLTLPPETVEKLGDVLISKGPEWRDECMAYLLARKSLQPGQDISSLSATIANFAISRPALFHQRVQEWIDKGRTAA